MARHESTAKHYGFENEIDLRASIAYRAGMVAATTLKVGDVFLGASPAADLAGCTSRKDKFAFVSGYMDHIPSKIMTDRETNKIVGLG